MTENSLRFSDIPRLTHEELNAEYPVQNYLKIPLKLHQLQQEIQRIESTRGERDCLPALRREVQNLEEELAKAPPDPVLPPPTPLIKVMGRLERFSKRRVMHYFDTEAFPSTHRYLKRQRERAESAALVVGAAGSAATAQGMLLEEGRIANVAWYVTGRINGRRFSGWLGRPYCRDGEEVELIVAPVGEEYLVYAINKPQERSLIMLPQCYRGVRQAKKLATLYPLGVIFFIFTLITIVWISTHGFPGLKNQNFHKGILMLVGIFTVIYFVPASWTIWRRYPFPKEELAEEIFTVLGWENVTDINLNKLNKRRRKQWLRTGKPENPFTDYTPFKCSGLGFGFYYY